MNSEINNKTSPEKKSGPGCMQVLGYAALIVLVACLAAAGWIRYNLYASEFSPVQLNQKEKKILDSKINMIHTSARLDQGPASSEVQQNRLSLDPEPYSEKDAVREISFTEKELNSMISDQPEASRRVAIDLSENLVSMKLVVPVDEDIIILGGKTIRLNLGLTLAYEDHKFVMALKGISLGGIPIPNAWLGYMKNKNLVEEFGQEGGFWALFAEGIKDIKVREGHILIKLNE